MLLPNEEGGMGYKVLWKSSKEGQQLSDLVSLSTPLSALPSLIEEGIQSKEGSGYDKSGYNPALQ